MREKHPQQWFPFLPARSIRALLRDSWEGGEKPGIPKSKAWLWALDFLPCGLICGMHVFYVNVYVFVFVYAVLVVALCLGVIPAQPQREVGGWVEASIIIKIRELQEHQWSYRFCKEKQILRRMQLFWKKTWTWNCYKFWSIDFRVTHSRRIGQPMPTHPWLR